MIIFQNNKQQILDEFDEAIMKALITCGGTAESYAKNNLRDSHAIDTGLLRNSVTWAIDGEMPNIQSYVADKGEGMGQYEGTAPKMSDPTVFVGTNVEYAPYIEFGTGAKNTSGGRDTPWGYKDKNGETVWTSGMPARPFIAPAVADHIEKYQSIFQKYLSQIGKTTE